MPTWSIVVSSIVTLASMNAFSPSLWYAANRSSYS
jgi:hypothetical protein